ncbi:Signal transducer regulating beta-lactamase production, contains metallopeptidase domain [Cohnella sp. OV330]|uniref:M56 family metallopeptidase n=1 Tax=Cohnella sp. OV330 TaxID=1855288 RepID=UPI0008EE75BD|nr:M56 family metallopeptidase [Cohnella sp. OV330]SFA76465.1 Signal transducer regulating beta-lactamase production, contains metallopeptidase domain [Cohnella sp. OV330]
MNAMLEMLFAMAVAGSVVAACIVFLRKVPVDLFPAKWRYRLQKIAILFYLLPIAVGISWIWPLIGSNPATVHDSPSVSDGGGLMVAEPPLSVPTIPVSAAFVILGICAIGAIGFAARQLYDYRRFSAALARTRIALPDRSEAAERLSLIKRELGLKGNVALAGSSMIRSPVLVGLRRPVIYLPAALPADVDLDMVLRHEFIHLKRKDLWVKAFALAVGALHWYNPLAHLLRKEIQIWSELSCDEEVVIGMSHSERKRYGITLLNVMAGSGNLPARFSASLSGDGKQFKRRLTLMLNAKKMKKKTMFLTVAALFLIAGVSTTAAVWASDNTPTVAAPVEAAPSGAEPTATSVPTAETAPAPTATAEEEAAAGPSDEPHATAAPAPDPTAAPVPSDEGHAVPTAAPAPAAAESAGASAAVAPSDEAHAVPETAPAPTATEAAAEPEAVPSVK